MLGVLAAIGLAFQWSLAKETEADLALRLARARDEVRMLEVTANKLEQFKTDRGSQEARLEVLRRLVPARLDGKAVEQELREVAKRADLEILDVTLTETKPQVLTEATFTLKVAGARAAAERFAAGLSGLPRLYRVDDILLPGPQGRMRVRAFAGAVAVPPRAVRETLCAIPADRPLAFLTDIAELREKLASTCARLQALSVVDKQVAGFEATRRTVADLTSLVERIYALPAVAIETELTPARLSVSELRVASLEAEGPAPQATVSLPGGKTLRLRAGDRLADAVVTQVAGLGLFVQPELPAFSAHTQKQAPLRFSPPGPVPAVTLGHETTWITSPLLSDGTPDYGAWLNARYGAGVTPENNAAPALRAAFDQLVDAGQTFWDGTAVRGEDAGRPSTSRLQSRPWVNEDCPECVRRLARNEQPLSMVAEAAKRSRHFTPLSAGARISAQRIPSLLPSRIAANALAGRGMLRLGKGDLRGAAEDAVTIQKLALLVGQGPTLIERLIAVAIRGIGMPVLSRVAGAQSVPRVARALLSELAGLPEMPPLPETIDEGERVMALDRVLAQRQSMAERGGGGTLAAWDWWWPADEHLGPSSLGVSVSCLLSASTIDWDEALRLVNRRFDLEVAAFRAASVPERRQALASLQADDQSRRSSEAALDAELHRRVGGDGSDPVARAGALDEIGRTPEGRRRLAALISGQSSLLRAGISWNEGETEFRLGVTAVALAAHRLEKGGFPATLEALAAEYLRDRFAPNTPLPGYVWRYDAGATEPKSATATYALTAVPEAKGETGVRGFCVDSTGALRSTNDGSAPAVVNGVCDPAVSLVR